MMENYNTVIGLIIFLYIIYNETYYKIYKYKRRKWKWAWSWEMFERGGRDHG